MKERVAMIVRHLLGIPEEIATIEKDLDRRLSEKAAKKEKRKSGKVPEDAAKSDSPAGC